MNILTIGDSWASAVEGGTGIDRGWPQILGVPGNQRLAVRGSTARMWANNFENRLDWAIKILVQAGDSPPVVVTSLLGNDARALLGSSLDLYASDIQRDVAHMHTVLLSLHAACPHARQVVLLYADPFNTFMSRVAVAMLNQAIRTACGSLRVHLVSTGTVLSDGHFPGGRDVHPTREGHEKLANLIAGVCNMI